MRPALYAELSTLFSLEALEADRADDTVEAERLWDISAELHAKCEVACREEQPWLFDEVIA